MICPNPGCTGIVYLTSNKQLTQEISVIHGFICHGEILSTEDYHFMEIKCTACLTVWHDEESFLKDYMKSEENKPT